MFFIAIAMVVFVQALPEPSANPEANPEPHGYRKVIRPSYNPIHHAYKSKPYHQPSIIHRKPIIHRNPIIHHKPVTHHISHHAKPVYKKHVVKHIPKRTYGHGYGK